MSKKLNGGKWLRPATRLALLRRDGFSCVYCLGTVETGVALTIDHVTPRNSGGSNSHTNLVCACLSCNSARQDRPVDVFMTSKGFSPAEVADCLTRIAVRTQMDMTPHRKFANEILKTRKVTDFSGKK